MARVLLDRYALDEVIGAGGAATVYRAADRALDRVVAVKLLDDTVARSADPGGRDRFLREAKSAARFQHPNLVTVYDAGEDAGELFLVMEFVDGRTLAGIIADRAPLPIDEAVSIATQILGGLAAMHRHGTIHRDIKPANVLVDDDGRVRLADFGIAKQLDDIDAAVTAAGMLVGTPHYLAPEQATGQPVSAPTDVYQVGLVLDEMLTGHRAGGASPAKAATAAPVDPRRARPDVPDQVADAVLRATQREPGRRFDSAEAMIDALAGHAAEAPVARASGVAASLAAPLPLTKRTMTMPLNGATGMLPGAPAGGAGAPPTVVAVPSTASPGRDPVVARQQRNWLLFSGGLLIFTVLGALAIVYGGDADGTLLPGSSTTVPETAPTTLPMVVTVPPSITSPTVPATIPPTAGVADDDKPGKGNDDDKPGKGGENDDEGD